MPEKGTNKGELPPEVDKYLAALVKDPKSKAFVPLADAYRKAGMLDEAIQVARDGLKYNPNYASGRLVLGRCYFEKDMLKEAEDEISRVIKINPENADAQKILAKIKERTGRIDEAIKIWDIVLTLTPNDSEAKQRIGVLKATVSVKEESEPSPTEQVEEKKEEEEKVEVKEEVKVEEKEEEREEKEEKEQQQIPEKAVGEQESFSPELREATAQSVEAEKETTISEDTVSKTEACEIPVPETEKEVTEGEKSAILSDKQEISATVAREISTAEEPEKASPIVDEKISESAKRDTPLEEISGEKVETVKKEEGISIRALAELYIKQGFLERALKVYKELEASSPDDVEIKERISFIQKELSKKKSQEPHDAKFKDNIKTLSSWLEKIKRGG